MSYMKNFVDEVQAMYIHGASVEYIASCCDVAVEQVEAAIEMLMDDPDFCARAGMADAEYLDSDCHLEQVQ